MATPLIEAGDCTVSGNNTATASWAVSHPNASTGDLLIWNIGWDDSTTTATVTPPSGPNGETLTSIAGPIASASTEVRGQSWYTIATGTWTSGTRTFTPAASESWTATVIRAPAGEFDAADPIGAAATRASAGIAETSVLSPALNAGSTDGGGRLVWFGFVDADPLGATNPTGWTILQRQDLGAVAHGVATRNAAVTASESIAGGDQWAIAGDSWASIAYIVRSPPTLLDGTGTFGGDVVASGELSALIQGVRTWDETGLDWDASGAEWDQIAPEAGIQGTASLGGTVAGSGAISFSLGLEGTAAVGGTVAGVGVTQFPLVLFGTGTVGGEFAGTGAVELSLTLSGSALFGGTLVGLGETAITEPQGVFLAGTAALTFTLAGSGAIQYPLALSGTAVVEGIVAGQGALLGALTWDGQSRTWDEVSATWDWNAQGVMLAGTASLTGTLLGQGALSEALLPLYVGSSRVSSTYWGGRTLSAIWHQNSQIWP